MKLPNIFDALTIPNPDTFRSAASNLNAGNEVYSTYHSQLMAGHDILKASWQSDASSQYSATYQQMHDLQQQHQEQLQQAAAIHMGVVVLLETAQIAQDIALGLLAGAGIEFIAGFFTAGATDVLAAPETAEAIQTEAAAQGSAAAARATLQTGFRALIGLTEAWKDHKLLFDAGGAVLGASSGLIYSIEHHDSLGQTGLNVGMDTWMGFDVGKNLSSDNPMTLIKALGGTVIGVEQYVTSGNKNDEDPFATIANWSLLTSGGNHGDKNLVPEGDNPLASNDELTQNIDENADSTVAGDGNGNQPPNNNGGGGKGGGPSDDENWIPPNDGNIHQNSNILARLYQKAGPAYNELKEFATHFVNSFGSGETVFGGLKGIERATQKVRDEYANDTSRLLDIARGTIKFDTLEDINQAKAKIEGELKKFAPGAKIIRFDDRYENPLPSGYRDIKLNIRMSNGHIVELQINTTAMLEAKKEETGIYNIARAIRDNAKTAGRPLTSSEINRIGELEQKSRAIFEPALRKLGLP